MKIAIIRTYNFYITAVNTMYDIEKILIGIIYMKIQKVICFFIKMWLILIICVSVNFAEIKIFTKEAIEVVPADKSQDQVIDYLKTKLTRQANEEAGKFITSELNIENKKIKKDEFTSVAGSISKVAVENKETFTKDNQQYVKVKVNIEVDTDSIQPYLDKILQDNQYKKEADESRKKTLELEEQLKTATKKQYEHELSVQVQQQVELQKQRAIELNEMVIEAKEEYAKIKEEQSKQQTKREQEILKLEEEIAQEKDNIKKAELENQAKIKELELKANKNQQNWNINSNKISIQQAIQEATKIKKETTEIINKFEILLKENKENIIKSYDKQLLLSLDNSKKGEWETKEEYNERLEKSRQARQKLEQEKEYDILIDKEKILESMITAITPYIQKLIFFQAEKFYDKYETKSKLISIDKINVEKNFFIMNIKYNNKEYKLDYYFTNIGREKAKLMYQTQNQFVITPFFSVNDKLKQELMGFDIKHLGTNEEKAILIKNNINPFNFTNFLELKDSYNNYYSKKLNTIKLLDEELKNFKETKNLKYFKKNIKDLENIKTLLMSDKISIKEVQDYLLNLKEIRVAVVNYNKTYLFLLRDGTVFFYDYNDSDAHFKDKYKIKRWKDIVAICCYEYPHNHFLGLAGINKRGQIFSNTYNLEVKKWLDKNKDKLNWAKDKESSYSVYKDNIIALEEDNLGQYFFYGDKKHYFLLRLGNCYLPDKIEMLLKKMY